MKIVVLDAKTLGDDISLDSLEQFGDCTVYPSTATDEVASRITDCDVVILNKIKLNETNLSNARNLKLICVTATGFDNIDVEYCKTKGIAVCNVVGYSSHSVAQVTVSMALSLFTHLSEYNDFVKSGEYSESGIANKLTPVYREIYGKTWGIIGYGNIGKEVGDIARALGCEIIVNKRTPVPDIACVDIDTICKRADIISIHTPLNSSTENLIDEKKLALMKKDVVLVNAARGMVINEKAVADAVSHGKIGAFGTDVYSKEPFDKSHPFYNIKDLPNVLLTPHMAWGAMEARERCIEEIVSNIKDFLCGGKRNRVDI